MTLTSSGDTARLCSKYRPSVPIVTVTRNPDTCRSAHLHRGVYPCLYPKAKPADPALWQEDVDARLKWGMKQAIDLGLISTGDAVIAVQGWTGGLGHSNTLRVSLSVSFPLIDTEVRMMLTVDSPSEWLKQAGIG